MPVIRQFLFKTNYKVTVQFETDGNDQNKIINNLDRSIVNL